MHDNILMETEEITKFTKKYSLDLQKIQLGHPWCKVYNEKSIVKGKERVHISTPNLCIKYLIYIEQLLKLKF